VPHRVPIIQGSYYHDILDQPTALAATLANLEASPALVAMLQAGPFKQVVLTGMGSSHHVLQPLHLQLAGRGIASTLMETSELIHYGKGLLEPGTLVVAVSQSGSSAETLRLLDLNRGAVILGVTNTDGSPLAIRSAAHILTMAGAERTVSCKTYVAALVALRWLGDLLCGVDPTATLQELAQAPILVETFLSDLEGKVKLLTQDLDGIRSLFLVGRGTSLASTGTGALIIKEAAHFHAEGMSSAAFRHGPMEMIHPEMFVLVFAGHPATRSLNERLLAEILTHGGKGALCNPPPLPESLRPLMEILHVQAITLALAALKGKEAGAFRWATKITTTE